MTSHDAIYKLRKILKMKRIGHTGTLDPDVDGVLPICLGQATRVAEYITDGKKAYRGEIILGASTTTEDASGDIIESREVMEPIRRELVEEVLQTFFGEISQTPPMYSAVKVKGKKLYEYAREGKTVERPTRKAMIYSIHLLDDSETYLTEIPFEVFCGKGTYVRTLAVNIGQKLGYPAHLNHLTRILSGGYRLEECRTLEEIERAAEQGQMDQLLAPIEKALEDFQIWIVDEETELRVKNGAVLPQQVGFKDQPIAVYNSNRKCLAIYRKHPEKEGLIKPDKVFIQP
jgi:tRNA pseudouridine55 synthase